MDNLFRMLHLRTHNAEDILEMLVGSCDLPAKQLPDYFRKQKAMLEAEIVLDRLCSIHLIAAWLRPSMKDSLVACSLENRECLSVPAKVAELVEKRKKQYGRGVRLNVHGLVIDRVWEMEGMKLGMWMWNLERELA